MENNDDDNNKGSKVLLNLLYVYVYLLWFGAWILCI